MFLVSQAKFHGRGLGVHPEQVCLEIPPVESTDVKSNLQ